MFAIDEPNYNGKDCLRYNSTTYWSPNDILTYFADNNLYPYIEDLWSIIRDNDYRKPY